MVPIPVHPVRYINPTHIKDREKNIDILTGVRKTTCKTHIFSDRNSRFSLIHLQASAKLNLAKDNQGKLMNEKTHLALPHLALTRICSTSLTIPSRHLHSGRLITARTANFA